MSKPLPILGRTADGGAFAVDVDKLVGAHLALIANSGAGKSRSVRKLLEATHGRLQHIVIDDEQEFYTLRERFDYVIVGGKSGDCPATPDNAEALALALLENGLSAIVQTGSLDTAAGQVFVSRFLLALLKAPEELWHPALVVLDEAQRFAPNATRNLSSDAVAEFAASARKRGYTMVVATGRFSAIDTEVRAHCVNWLIGRAGLTLDRRAAAHELGFPPSSPEAKGLRSLDLGQFWAFGSALAAEPTLMQFGDVLTTHLQRGQARVPTPPPPKKLRAILAGLAAIATPKPDEATPTVPSGGSGVKPPPATNPDPAAIAAAEARGRAQGADEAFPQGSAHGLLYARESIETRLRTLGEAEQAIERAMKCLGAFRRSLATFFDEAAPAAAPTEAEAGRQARPASKPKAALATERSPAPPAEDAGAAAPSVTNPQLAVLKALAWWRALGHDAPTRAQVAAIAGWKPTGSNIKDRASELVRAGLVSYGGGRFGSRLELTQSGIAAAPEPDLAVTPVASVRAILTNPQRQVFDVLVSAHSDEIHRDDLAEAVGWKRGGSNIKDRLSELGRLDLIERPGSNAVRAADWLFEGWAR